MAEIFEKIQDGGCSCSSHTHLFHDNEWMLKNIIDRFHPKWKDLGGHDVYLIITGHDEKKGLSLVGEELTEIFLELENIVKGIIWG